MAFLLDDTTLKVENYIIVIEFYKLELNKIAARWPAKAVAQRFSAFYNKKQWKASPKSSIVKSPQRNNQSGSTFPLLMKRIPSFRLVGKRFYDSNAPPCKAVF